MVIEVCTDFFCVMSQKPGDRRLGLRCLLAMGFSDECDEMKFLGELQVDYIGRACFMVSEILLYVV